MSDAVEEPATHPRPSNVFSAWDEAMDTIERRPTEIVEIDLGGRTGLSSRNVVKLVILPPGTRLQPPLAHSAQDTLVTCISGAGLVWQNGVTFHFTMYDAGGWKGGAGASWTILNDAGPGSEDLALLVVQERNPENKIHFPLPNDIIPDAPIWTDGLPTQNDHGPHPGTVGIAADGTVTDVPDIQDKYRPSNIQNGPEMLDTVGIGEKYCEATSLTHDTGLSGRFGVNFEVGPPGTRSSDAHAHSAEDELIFVLGGEGLVWINGTVYPVTTGDAVGFPSGTGDAHTFINDSNKDDVLAGQPLALWIFGENKRTAGDLIYYPLNPENEETIEERWWEDAPKHDLGPHPGRPSQPAGLL